MVAPDLAVIIPARNEEWLGRTVQDVLISSGERTRVVVILDGNWPEPGLPSHDRLDIIYHPHPVGQRAAVNYGARVTNARYIMKLDAHCSIETGFDIKLLDAAAILPRETVQVPRQRNLHVYDWFCTECDWRQDQGRQPKQCPDCEGKVEREILWAPRRGTTTTAWRFDSDLHFQYWKDWQVGQVGDYPETMSLLGACWFVERDWFLNGLDGLDEAHGSWGQMGTEIACKAWLSGGSVRCNMLTWFAHFFRVGGIGFPYQITGADQDGARRYSRALWLEVGWKKQTRPMSWLLNKFNPPGWESRPIPSRPFKPEVGVVYYSDCRGDQSILRAARRRLRNSFGGPIVAVTLAPTEDWGAAQIVLPLERGPLTMFRQQLAGLDALETDVVFFAEHDVLYPEAHFLFRPDTVESYAYNVHVWKVCAETGRALHYVCAQTSGLVADRHILLGHYRRRVAYVEEHGFTRRLGYEPGKPIKHGGVDDIPRQMFATSKPLVDIRHRHNLTASRWTKEEFRNQDYTEGWTEADAVPHWGATAGRFREFLSEVTR